MKSTSGAALEAEDVMGGAISTCKSSKTVALVLSKYKPEGKDISWVESIELNDHIKSDCKERSCDPSKLKWIRGLPSLPDRYCR